MCVQQIAVQYFNTLFQAGSAPIEGVAGYVEMKIDERQNT